MSDLFGKRTLTINGMEQVYDHIDDLADDIEICQSELRKSHALLTDGVDDRTLNRILANASAQRDRIETYNSWAEEMLAARNADIADLREALQNLPSSPFEEE